MKRFSLKNIPLPSLLFFILSVIVLSLGFYRNQWHVIREKKFNTFQLDSESLIVARMVESRQHGIFSRGMLIGWGDYDYTTLTEEAYQHQYDTYFNRGTFQTFSTYNSHPSFQALFFSALDQISPFEARTTYRLFRLFNAVMLAICISLIMLWFQRTIGWGAAILSCSAAVVSYWLTLYARNLVFTIWAYFVPMLVMFYLLIRERQGKSLSNRWIALAAFGTIFLKCLFDGYDYIICVLVMLAVPFIYFALQDRWGWKKFLDRFKWIVIASLLGILASNIVLFIEIWIGSGDASIGLEHILLSITRRTYSLPDQAGAERDISLWNVLVTYTTNETLIDVLHLRAIDLIVLFAAASLIGWTLRHRLSGDPASLHLHRSFLITTWVSILGPLGWYVIFKKVAVYHSHMNFLGWHMPFTLFGFAYTGWVVERLLRLAWSRIRLKSLPAKT